MTSAYLLLKVLVTVLTWLLQNAVRYYFKCLEKRNLYVKKRLLVFICFFRPNSFFYFFSFQWKLRNIKMYLQLLSIYLEISENWPNYFNVTRIRILLKIQCKSQKNWPQTAQLGLGIKSQLSSARLSKVL